MTTSTWTSIAICGGGGTQNKTKQSNFAAWEQSSEPEKKACGVLGVSRLKAHAG